MLYLVWVFYSSAHGVLPSSCSIYGTLHCADLALQGNALGGSQLVLLTSLSSQGSVNVSTFNAIVGGIKSSSVYYAPINNDGSLSSWIQTTPYPMSADFSCTISNGYLYCAGGPVPANSLPGDEWDYVTAVYSAPIYSNGAVGNWIGPFDYPTPYFLPDSAQISCSSSGGLLSCLTGAISSLGGDPYADEIFSTPLCSG